MDQEVRRNPFTQIVVAVLCGGLCIEAPAGQPIEEIKGSFKAISLGKRREKIRNSIEDAKRSGFRWRCLRLEMRLRRRDIFAICEKMM